MVELRNLPGSSATVPAPAYQRIEADLRRRIAAGEWQPGTRLPTQDQLCDEYRVSSQPIKTALMRLEVAGLVVRRQGGAAIVAGETPSES
jgi:DNA-binding GntR family transcriptional regulator